MSTVSTIAIVLLILALGVALWFLRRLAKANVSLDEAVDDWRVAHRDLHTGMISCLPPKGEVRYEVLLADWGPDFTGEGDILPRWRWSIVDADRDLRAVLGLDCEIGTDETPYMLGNDLTAPLAVTSALAWIEEQNYPAMRVTFAVADLAAVDG